MPKGYARPPVREAVDALRERYEREAAEVDRYTSSSFWDRRYHRQRLALVAELLSPSLSAATNFLDVGCGSGEYLVTATEAGVAYVCGVDLAMAYCRRARQLVCGSSIAQSAAEALPFRDRAFDVVLCSEVVEHIDPSAAHSALAELARVARRVVVVTTPNDRAAVRRLARVVAPARVRRLDAEVGHINLVDGQRLRQVLQSVGWRTTCLGTAHILPPVIGESLHLPKRFEPVVRVLERLAAWLAPSTGNCILSIAAPE